MPTMSRRWPSGVVFVALLVAWVPAMCHAVQKDGSDMLPRTPLDVTHPDVKAAAKFALEELQDLSDSGIYHTLSLASIDNAAYQEGVYHYNTFLKVSLSSPHLQDAPLPSVHEVIVMKSKEDSVLSFAIDEFPVMKDDAIEAFWVEKVEAHRAARERVFAQLEREVAKEAL